MLTATSFSLIVPAIAMSGPGVAVFGLILGALVLHLIDHFISHFHPALGAEGPLSKLSKIWLLVIAITIHNFLEGLAVGSASTREMWQRDWVATAIWLQNMPEGLAVALPLVREGYSRRKSLWYGTLTRLVEPVGGLLGVVLVSIFHPVLPRHFNGKKGKTVYVGYKGKVYDVSNSFLWKDGTHQAFHNASMDLTAALKMLHTTKMYSKNSQWLESYIVLVF